ncbi:uncharacterized protein LOC121750708 isoform X4 [Salvia splendens]|uniref:uncharacterized protein LOC121750708 isoform X4 n=1 Tax=Salvia splendens TaxID=180675 RepID=UPI001C27DCB9|nr:uncharacterized protein LOC121750708 isoform X4 [Salvia splendens]
MRKSRKKTGYVVMRAEGIYDVDANTSIDQLSEELHIKMPEGHQYETISGFVCEAFGYIPRTGETIQVVLERENQEDHVNYPTGKKKMRKLNYLSLRCGRGKMELRRAGKMTTNAGRYYFKCPDKLTHVGSFQWYDEAVRGLGQGGKSGVEGQGKPVMAEEQRYYANCSAGEYKGGGHCCRASTPNDLKTLMQLGFMAVVLVVVGIIIGMLL